MFCSSASRDLRFILRAAVICSLASKAGFRLSPLGPALLMLLLAATSAREEDGAPSERWSALSLARARSRLAERPLRVLLALATGASTFAALRGLRRTTVDALAMGTIPCRRNIFLEIASCSVAGGIASMLSCGGPG